jgi:hypothetical protein
MGIGNAASLPVENIPDPFEAIHLTGDVMSHNWMVFPGRVGLFRIAFGL